MLPSPCSLPLLLQRGLAYMLVVWNGVYQYGAWQRGFAASYAFQEAKAPLTPEATLALVRECRARLEKPPDALASDATRQQNRWKHPARSEYT